MFMQSLQPAKSITQNQQGYLNVSLATQLLKHRIRVLSKHIED